jgi:hypothetical protein
VVVTEVVSSGITVFGPGMVASMDIPGMPGMAIVVVNQQRIEEA